MNFIKVFFQNHDPIIIELINDPVSLKFFKLVKINLEKEKPIFRDQAKYNEKYLQELAIQLKKELNWNWLTDEYSLENTIIMHKEIENLLEKEYSFRNIPGSLQNLIHEAHFCIHSIQYQNKDNLHGVFLQIEWFNDDFIDLDEDFKFSTKLSFGDVILQNPYVGHPPIQCYQQNDYKNILRTCTFHDKIKPGIKIVLKNSPKDLDKDKYENWWHSKGREFVDLHGFMKIWKYTGFPIVGKVKNLDTLVDVLKTPLLELNKIVLKDSKLD